MRNLKYGTYGYTHLNIGEKKQECCGTCKHHRKRKQDPDWTCNNPDSDCYADFTGYKDYCENYEARPTR